METKRLGLHTNLSTDRRGVCCIFPSGNTFESFPPAGTHYIKMIHSLRVWSVSCSSLHFHSVCVCITAANTPNNCSEIYLHILIIHTNTSVIHQACFIKANKCVCFSTYRMDVDDYDYVDGGVVLRVGGILK